MSKLQPSAPVGDVTLFTALDWTRDPGFFAHFLDHASELAQTVARADAPGRGLAGG